MADILVRNHFWRLLINLFYRVLLCLLGLYDALRLVHVLRPSAGAGDAATTVQVWQRWASGVGVGVLLAVHVLGDEM